MTGDGRWQPQNNDQMEILPSIQARSLHEARRNKSDGLQHQWCNHASPAGLLAEGSGARGTGEKARLRASAVAFWRRKAGTVGKGRCRRGSAEAEVCRRCQRCNGRRNAGFARLRAHRVQLSSDDVRCLLGIVQHFCRLCSLPSWSSAIPQRISNHTTHSLTHRLSTPWYWYTP